MLLCIVSCRQVVSVDAIWRQFLMEQKTCNLRKLWYNHDTLGRDCFSAMG